MRKIRALCYHRVEKISNDWNLLAVTPDNFREQMKFLRKHYDILALDELEDKLENGVRDAVIITFDDGYYDLLYQALPILEEYHIPAVMFITTGNIGTERENWTDSILRAIFDFAIYREEFALNDDLISGKWHTRSMQERLTLYGILRSIFMRVGSEKRQEYERQLLMWAGLPLNKGRKDRRMLTADEVKRLSQSPFVSIGAHCVTHPSLSGLSMEEQRYEIQQSKKMLEDITGKEINLFAYPFGTKTDYTEDTIELLKTNGYKKAVIIQDSEITAATDHYQIPRYGVRNYEILDFEDYINNIVFDNQTSNKRKDQWIQSKVRLVENLETDWELFPESQKMIIWGCGYWGTKLYEFWEQKEKSEYIIAFGDNDDRKIGTIKHGIPVMGLEGIKQLLEKQEAVILVKGIYGKEICENLVEQGIQNIYLILGG